MYSGNLASRAAIVHGEARRLFHDGAVLADQISGDGDALPVRIAGLAVFTKVVQQQPSRHNPMSPSGGKPPSR